MDSRFSGLDWSLVQSFLAVADAGSLSAAARLLGSSQPTLGRHIRQIEAELGVALFRRQRRGLALTEAGEACLAPARRMAEALHDFGFAAEGRRETARGTVRITASAFMALHHLPQIVAGIRRRAPELAIELVASDASENLLFHEADIAVRMYRPEQLDIVALKIGELELGVYAARSYVAQAGPIGDLDDLARVDLVGYDRNEQILQGFRRFGMPAVRDWFATRCDDNNANWALVRAGCGVGFAQVSVGDADPAVERLLPDLPLPGLPLWLATHEAIRHDPAISLVWVELEGGLRSLVKAG